MLSWIRDHLSQEARQLGIPIEKLTFLKRIGGDLSPDGKALFEILGPDSPVPLWVVKAARTRHGNTRLQLEHQRLKHLFGIHSRATTQGLDPQCCLRIPTPILFEERSNGSLSVETFLTGVRVSQLLQQPSQPDPWASWKEISSLALRGLLTYSQCENPRSINIDSEWWNHRLLEPLAPHYNRLISVSSEWHQIWEALREASAWTFLGETVPQHGDFTPANMVLEGGSIGVFDWSSDDLEAPPLLDLIHFLASASLFLGQGVEHKTKVTEMRTCLLIDRRFFEPVAQTVLNYINTCGLGDKDIHSLSLASFGSKILNMVQRPESVDDYLSGWLWTTSEWIQGGGAKKLISFAKEKDFA